MAEAAELLAFRNVERAFGRLKALAGVDFSVAPSEFVGLLAPAGSGKTAILNLCVGLGTPDRGAVVVDGKQLGRRPTSVRSQIGAVMGATDLELDRSVKSNLRFAANLFGLRRTTAETRIASLLSRFRLDEHVRDRVRSLSDLQRRRVAIARALVHKPKLLLLNGITGGLEPGLGNELLDDVAKLVTEEDTAVLWATERADELEGVTRLMVLHRGRMAFDGSPEALRAQTGQSSLSAAWDTLMR